METLKHSQEEAGWIAKDLQPWDHTRLGFEPITSHGMRLDGEVVGWCINHPISPTTLRFTCSYIRKDLGRRGRILPLYTQSLKLLHLTKYSACTFTAPVYHPTMARFAKKHCGPYASYIGETRGSHKALVNPEELSGPASPQEAHPTRAEGGDRVNCGSSTASR